MYVTAHVPATALELHIGDGRSGIVDTISVMREYVRHYRADPDIRQIAANLVHLSARPKDRRAEADAVFRGVQSWIRYLPDVCDIETLASPLITWQTRIGDCDCISTLLASLLESIGFRTRFVVTGYNLPEIIEHVYVHVDIDGNWIDLDATESHGSGYSPPNPLAIMFEVV